jgi:gluconolactonase
VRATASRRDVLFASLGLASLAGCATQAHRYAGLDTRRWLGAIRTLAVLDEERSFAEGPVVAPDQNVYFSNLRANRIMQYSPATQTLAVFRENSHGANGLKFDAQGRLVVCEGALGRITRLDASGAADEVLCSRFEGNALEDVNDLALDTQGRIYFTSRPRNRDRAAGNVSAVYRLDPDGALLRLLARPEVEMPNGLAISPDQSTFYLIDSNGESGGRRELAAYALSRTGELSRRRLLHDFVPGRGGDGMCVDRAGNLYVAAGLHAKRPNTAETLDVLPGIHVFSPQGRLLAFARTPEDTVTNCAFGHGATARTLYVTCGRQLLAIETTLPGPV